MEHLLDALLTAFIPAAAVLLAAAVYCLLPGLCSWRCLFSS